MESARWIDTAHRHVRLLFALAGALGLLAGCGKSVSDVVGAARGRRLETPPLARAAHSFVLRELTIDCTLPPLPDDVPVYAVRNADVDRQTAQGMADRLGLGATVQDRDWAFLARSGSGELVVNKQTGRWSYSSASGESGVEPLSAVLPDEEYRRLATDFLAKNGLMKPSAEFDRVVKNTASRLVDGKDVTYPFSVVAVFRHREISGIPVTGVGEKIWVEFGDAGKIVGADCVWREAEDTPIARYRIIAPEAAASGIESGRGQILTQGEQRPAPGTSGRVLSVHLAYYSHADGDDQKYLIPYYQLKGVNSGGTRFLATIEALSPADLKVTGH